MTKKKKPSGLAYVIIWIVITIGLLLFYVGSGAGETEKCDAPCWVIEQVGCCFRIECIDKPVQTIQPETYEQWLEEGKICPIN